MVKTAIIHILTVMRARGIAPNLTALGESYGRTAFKADLTAGLTVAVVALPLSLALAIASGVAPARGLFTAVVAGTVVSALGGSRYQIAGPTGAFVVVVAGVVRHFGYEGLAAATLLAGVLLIAAALAGLGEYIRHVPHPVVTGFTAGIAVVIFASQLGDLLGLSPGHIPADTMGKLAADAASLPNFTPQAALTGLGTLLLIAAIRKVAPRAPAFLIALALASLSAWLLALPIATIGTRFGMLPSALPQPHWPEPSAALLPAAFTIFVLGGIESLLSATVADKMTGQRHRPNAELAAQGLANIASALMGGIPATGAIARTATNIRAGARTAVSGIVHALAILAMMAAFAPLASYIPLAALAAVLAVVCWSMAEPKGFARILGDAPADRAVLIVTFLTTIFVDLSYAIAAGIGLSLLLNRALQRDPAKG